MQFPAAPPKVPQFLTGAFLFAMIATMFISVDLGGTNTRVAGALDLLEPSFVGEPQRRRNTHTYNEDLQFIIDCALQIAGGAPIEAIGFGAAGGVSDDKAQIAGSNNLTQWIGRPLVAEISAKLNCPVFLDNDGVAAGLGEAYYGATRGNFHYVIWGTGISVVSITRDDEDVPMARRINWQEYCKDWEAACAGGSIERLYGKQPEELDDSEWRQVTEEFNVYLMRYINIQKPAAIVFGGGLAMLHGPAITAVQQDVPLSVSGFDKDAGLVGGLALIRRGMKV